MSPRPEPLEARPIHARHMNFDFDTEVPRWWLHNNPVVTHFSNGLNMVFPEGERFFIRSVKRYQDRITNPELKERIRGFFGQEAQHGKEHRRAFDLLREQGYEIDNYLEYYEKKALPFLENKTFGPLMALSVTVALEHLTASMGEAALTDGFLEGAHPVMRDLLKWHAAEEIEHKSVAFDVLKEVNDNYLLRVSGMFIALAGISFFARLGARRLIKQDNLSKAEIKRYRKEAMQLRGNDMRKLYGNALKSYLDPKFHPDNKDNYHLAQNYLQQAGIEAA